MSTIIQTSSHVGRKSRLSRNDTCCPPSALQIKEVTGMSTTAETSPLANHRHRCPTTTDIGWPLSTAHTLGRCSECPHSNNKTPVLQELIRTSTRAEASQLSDIGGGQHHGVNRQHLTQFDTDKSGEARNVDFLHLHGTTRAVFESLLVSPASGLGEGQPDVGQIALIFLIVWTPVYSYGVQV